MANRAMWNIHQKLYMKLARNVCDSVKSERPACGCVSFASWIIPALQCVSSGMLPLLGRCAAFSA